MSFWYPNRREGGCRIQADARQWGSHGIPLPYRSLPCPAQGATIQSPSAQGKKDHGVEEAGRHPRGATAGLWGQDAQEVWALALRKSMPWVVGSTMQCPGSLVAYDKPLMQNQQPHNAVFVDFFVCNQRLPHLSITKMTLTYLSKQTLVVLNWPFHTKVWLLLRAQIFFWLHLP